MMCLAMEEAKRKMQMSESRAFRIVSIGITTA
jgi:hypothetical protein